METPLIETITGTNDKGNSFLILSGVHGDEITPVAVVNNLRFLIKNSFIDRNFKSLTFAAGINPSGIKSKQRNYSINLNRIPKTNYNPVDTIKELISKNNVIIDIHSSSNIGNFFLVDKDDYTSSIVKILNSISCPYVIRKFNEMTIKKYSNLNNKIGFTYETNGINKIDYSVIDIVSADILKLIVKLKDKVKLTKDETNAPEYTGIIYHGEGFYKSIVKPNSFVIKNQPVGYVASIDGSIQHVVKSYLDGMIANDMDGCFVSNEYVCFIQEKYLP